MTQSRTVRLASAAPPDVEYCRGSFVWDLHGVQIMASDLMPCTNLAGPTRRLRADAN